MRAFLLFLALIASALLAAGCMGGPDDGDRRLAEACERQIQEVAEDESSTPTAKSTEERLEEETLVECAGQNVVVTAADEEGEDADKGAGKDTGVGEDPGSGGDETTPATLDPEARDMFTEACGSCHELSDAGTTGSVGPGLDDTELDATGITDQIIKGGGGMPPRLLEGEDAEAVGTYVAAAAASE